MDSLFSTSESSPLHALIANVSCLFGVTVFLQQMWGHASLEHTLLTAASAGLAAYLILAAGYAVARGVLAYDPSADSASPEANGDEEASAENDVSKEASSSTADAPDASAELQAA